MQQQLAYKHIHTYIFAHALAHVPAIHMYIFYIKIHCESFLSHSLRDVIENDFNVCVLNSGIHFLYVLWSWVLVCVCINMCVHGVCICLFDECVHNVQPQQSLICSTQNSV